MEDLELLLQVGDAVLRLLQLVSLVVEFRLELLDLVLLLLDQGPCCLILSGQFCGFGLFFFLFLEGKQFLLLLHFFILAGELLGLELGGDLLLLCIVNHLFQLFFFGLGSLEKDVAFGDGPAQLLQLLFEHSNLHLVVLNVFFGNFQ